MRKIINQSESHSNENKIQQADSPRKASVTKIIMVKDKRASVTRIQVPIDNLTETKTKEQIRREQKSSSVSRGYDSDTASIITNRYSVTRILPVRGNNSNQETYVVMRNQKRSVSLDRAAAQKKIYMGKNNTGRRYSVTRIVNIGPSGQVQRLYLNNTKTNINNNNLHSTTINKNDMFISEKKISINADEQINRDQQTNKVSQFKETNEYNLNLKDYGSEEKQYTKYETRTINTSKIL